MMVRWITLIGGLLLLLGAQSAWGQSTADGLFHTAARQYVSGEEAAARRTVERGLEVAPSDPRLLALQETLEEQASRRPGGGQSGSSGASGADSDASADGAPDRGNRSEADPSEARSETEEGAGEESSPRESGQAARGTDERGSEASVRPGERGESGDRPAPALSPEQARRLLQALEAQEEQLLRQVRVRSLEEQSVEKDW